MRKGSSGSERARARRRGSGLLALSVVGALLLSALAAAPAFAVGALTITKGVSVGGGAPVDAASIGPGDEFSYVINLQCSDDNCPDATITDPLPAEFAGFEILSTTVTPGSGTAGYAGCSTTVTDSCTLTVAFDTPIDGGAGGAGIPAGQSGGVILTLRAPDTLTPDWASNGVPVTNTATGDAGNVLGPVSDPADVTVTIPVVVGTDTTKDWSPEGQLYNPGEQSTITLTTRNASNTEASSLVLTEPTSAVDGASSLGADNPFAIVDFAGFGTIVFPEGATQVQVDAYVYDGSTWNWVDGAPGAEPELPGGVGDADVGGLRFTFTDPSGAVIAPDGAAGTVPFTVAQRSTNRETDAPLVGGATVTNSATGTVTVPGEDPVSVPATDDFVIGPLDVLVEAGKTITPPRMPAGTSATATLTAKNDSNGPLTTLTISDLDFFTEDITFAGFTTPIAWPDGTTDATITWHYSDSGADVTAPLPDGSQPTPPAAPAGEHLTGFEITFTGSIPAGTTVAVPFSFDVSSDFVPEDNTTGVTVPNTVTVTGTNPAGSDDDSSPSQVQVFAPDISLEIDKQIAPSAPVAPGGTVTVSLPTSTSTDSAFVEPTDIVITDVWDGTAGNFWNAFNPVAIAPMTVPAGSTLTVEYTTDGTHWAVGDTVDATGGAQLYQLNVPAFLQSTIVGVRFTFHDDAGFPQGTTVIPNITFQARSTLRLDGTEPAVPGGDPETYTNVAVADGQGEVAGGTTVDADEVEADADAQIVVPDGAGIAVVDKTWRTPDLSQDLSTLDSQSGEQAATRIRWGVTSTGFSELSLIDAVGYENPVNTVFQAFDLIQVMPISFTTDPLLRWDMVSSVQLWYDGDWHEVTAPAGGWMDGTGFRGYPLTPLESARTTGVQIMLVPNDAARNAPGAPPIGSGIATSPADPDREIDFLWQLRNVARDSSDGRSQWVTADRLFNTFDHGVVANEIQGTGVFDGIPVGPVYDADTVTLLDQPPSVDVAKTSEKPQIVVPNKGDVPADGYPTNAFTITARNTGVSLLPYVRVTDPMPCDQGDVTACLSDPADWSADPYAAASYDPGTNPFERFDLTGVQFTTPPGVDRTASMVTLWHRAADGTLSTTVASIDATQAMTDLTDVVGVSVLYQGTDPAATGGSIPGGAGNDLVMTLNTRVRVDLRSQPGTAVQPFLVANDAFTQAYDPVLFPSGQGSTPSDAAGTTVDLIGGKLGIAATKQLDPPALLEADRDDPVTATLTATSGTGEDAATVPTNQVRLEDTDAEFWDAFRLTGLGSVTLPAGSDQVKVDVQVDGDPTWIEGVAGPTAELPGSVTDLSRVTGIRITFDRADGGLLSNSAPPASFTATAVLNLLLRDSLLSGGPVVFPATVSNTLHAVSHRTDQPALYPDAVSDGPDSIDLDPGTFRLDVSKQPPGNIHTVVPGQVLPWTMTFTNTGTGFLDVRTLVDTLPIHLEWDQLPPTFQTTVGGTLSTSPAYDYDPLGRTLTVTFPDGGDRLSPGETYTITLGLSLAPGLTEVQRATNQMVVSTDQTLADCSNTSGNGQGVLTGLPAADCGTTNYVSPVTGPGLITSKGVQGDVVDSLVTGAVNTIDPQQACLPDSAGYYAYPCAANTRVGGTDAWRIGAVNSGTVPLTSLVLVDPLPHVGDVLLATGSARGSAFRPVLDGAFGFPTSAPLGTTVTVEVSTDADVCTGASGTDWTADSTCAANTWTDASAYAGDWSEVTGIRATFDFSGAVGGALAAGADVSVEFRTVDEPVSATLPDGAPIDIPVAGGFAWNQNGATAVPASGATLQLSPVKAGVTLASGPLEIAKTVSGDAAAYAPDTFPFTVACTVAGQPIDMTGVSPVDVPKDDSVRIDGIPLGSECVVTEQGATGSNGETGRSPDAPQTITILQDGDPTPAAQVAAFDNVYDFGGLSVTKAVDTDANVGAFGPFAFHIVCTAPAGGAGGTVLDDTFTLSGGDSYDAPDDTLPIGSSCLLTETDSGGAGGVTITGAGVVDNGDGSATVPVGADVQVIATNAFPVGVLQVTKQLSGDGADRYGSGPFTVQAVCTWPDAGTQVYTGEVELVGGQTERFTLPNGDDALMPVGTECALTETATGGATGDPTFSDGTTTGSPGITVTIVDRGSAQPEQPTAVTVDNPFETGEISVVKAFDGRGTDLYGAGPFTVRLECGYDKDGVMTPIMWNGEDHLDLELNEQNGFAATVEDLLVGAECAITAETVTGGATGVVIGDAVIVPGDGGDPVTITVTNSFPAGSLLILKQRTGAWQEFGAGPFTVQVTCRWTVDGVLQSIPVPGGSTVVLSAANGYRAVIDLLPVGAECTVVETDAGKATSTSYSPADGTVTILENDEDAPDAALATIVITNDFDPGELGPTGVDGTALLASSTTAAGMILAGLALLIAVRRRRRLG